MKGGGAGGEVYRETSCHRRRRRESFYAAASAAAARRRGGVIVSYERRWLCGARTTAADNGVARRRRSTARAPQDVRPPARPRPANRARSRTHAARCPAVYGSRRIRATPSTESIRSGPHVIPDATARAHVELQDSRADLTDVQSGTRKVQEPRLSGILQNIGPGPHTMSVPGYT